MVASIQVDLDDNVLDRFRQDLLRRVHETGSRGVILDVSGLETLDPDEFAALRGIIRTCAIMGSESILAGLRPGVVSALVEAGADIDGLRAAINLDAAFSQLELQSQPDIEPETDMEPGDEDSLDPESPQALTEQQ